MCVYKICVLSFPIKTCDKLFLNSSAFQTFRPSHWKKKGILGKYKLWCLNYYYFFLIVLTATLTFSPFCILTVTVGGAVHACHGCHRSDSSSSSRSLLTNSERDAWPVTLIHFASHSCWRARPSTCAPTLWVEKPAVWKNMLIST